MQFIHLYFEDLKKSPIAYKIAWGIANINLFFAAFNLITFIVSKIKKKERWRIVEYYYRDETWETTTYYDDEGKETSKSPPKLIHTENEIMEPDQPVRID